MTIQPNNPPDRVIILEPTWGRCLKVWWSLFWRVGLLGLGIGLTSAVAVGVVLGLIGMEKEEVGPVIMVVMFFVWFLWSLLAVKKSLAVKYHEFGIGLIARRSAAGE